MTTEWTIAQHRERILQDFRTCTTTNLLPRTRTPRSRDSSRKRKATGRRIPWKRRVLVLSLRRRILQVRYRTAISTMIARSTVIYEHFPRNFLLFQRFPIIDYRPRKVANNRCVESAKIRVALSTTLAPPIGFVIAPFATTAEIIGPPRTTRTIILFQK